MEDRMLLESLFYRLKEIKDEQGIRHITEIKPDGKHPLTFYSEVTDRRLSDLGPPAFLWDDFFFISNDLVHFTEWLYLLRPLVNDATQEDGTYRQNWYDAKYLSYAAILNAAIYNFWDRIGDLLNCFFETGLPADGVYVGRVMNNIPNKHKISDHYQRINKIYVQDVQPHIAERSDDAHNLSLATRRFYDILMSRGSQQEDEVGRKLGLPELFEKQIDLAYEGFELALRFIDERARRRDDAPIHQS